MSQFIAAQHSVYLTGGRLGVFRHFSWLGVDFGKVAWSRPAHQRVTQAVRGQRSYVVGKHAGVNCM